MGRIRPLRRTSGRMFCTGRSLTDGRGSCRTGPGRGRSTLHRWRCGWDGLSRFLRGRVGRCAVHRCVAGTGRAFLLDRAGSCAACRGHRCGWGNISAGPGGGISGPLCAAGRLSCGTGLGSAGSGSRRSFRGSARIFPAGGAGLALFTPGFWDTWTAGMRCAGNCRRLRRGRSRCPPAHGDIGLLRGLGAVVHRTATRALGCGMSGAGGWMGPGSCRAGLPSIGLSGRRGPGRCSCRTGTGTVGLCESRGAGLRTCRTGLGCGTSARGPRACGTGTGCVWLLRRGVPGGRSCGAGPGRGGVERPAFWRFGSCRIGAGAVGLLGCRRARLSLRRCLGIRCTRGLSCTTRGRHMAGGAPGPRRHRAPPGLLALGAAGAALAGSAGIAGRSAGRRRLLSAGPGCIFLPGVGLLRGPMGGAALLVGCLLGRALLAGAVGAVPASTPLAAVCGLGAAKSASAARKAPAAEGPAGPAGGGRCAGCFAAAAAATNALHHLTGGGADHGVSQHTGQSPPGSAGNGGVQADAGDDGVRLLCHLHDGKDEHHPG